MKPFFLTLILLSFFSVSSFGEEKALEKEFGDVNSNFSELKKLSEFENIAVIQKRFLPKTGRFELSPTGLFVTNNSYFVGYGGGVNLSYYFKEKLAIEIGYQKYFEAERGIVKDVEEGSDIKPSQSARLDQLGYVAFKWTPVYGKIAWLNQSIIPFDLGFNLGLGLASAKYEERALTGRDIEVIKERGLSFLASMNQVFAISPNTAFRWDLGVTHYRFKKKDSNNKEIEVKQTDLYVGAGVSFFFGGKKK